jgi:hypothetical protein
MAIAAIFVDIIFPPATPILTAEGAAASAASTCATVCVVAKVAIQGGFMIITFHDVALPSTPGPGYSPGSAGPSANDPASTGNNPEGNAPTGTADAGAGSQGPGGAGNGSGSGAGSGSGVGSGTLPNGDQRVYMDIWHASAGCPNCGVIWGQSQAGVYWFMEDEAMTLAGGAILAKLHGLISVVPNLPRIRIAIGPGAIPTSPIHAAYEVGGKFLNAVGNVGFQRVSPYLARETFEEAWHVFSVPIRNEAAVLATKGRSAWTCVGAALYAIGKGWLP